MKRRCFLKSAATVATSVAVVGPIKAAYVIPFGNTNASGNVTVKIPLPIQVVIDDVGWWSGKDGSANQEPFRTGIARNHVPEDYQAIVSLGKALGIRPQAAMILCEWDRENILKKLPESTWMGEKWDNSKWIGPWYDQAASIINNNKEHIEISMHGIGHEWWVNGIASRAEWADDDGIMRPEKDVRNHIDAFAEILHQNKLGELPTSFVPANFAHSFGVTKGNKHSMAQIIKEYGFSYINTTFNYNFHRSERVQYGSFGVDSGILTVDRGTDLLRYNEISTQPSGEIIGSTCGLHWPNLLHKNPERNQEIVDGWVKVLTPYQNRQETMLARNSLEFQQQIVHHKFTKAKVHDDEIHIDMTDTKAINTIIQNQELTIKVSSDHTLNFTSDSIAIQSISTVQQEIGEYSIIYTLKVKMTDKAKAVLSLAKA